MQTTAEMEGGVAKTLAIAHDWKAKGDFRSELSCLGGALDELLSIAVMQHDTPEAGIAYLHSRRADKLLLRYRDLNAILLDAFRQGYENAAVDNGVTVTHLCWLLGRDALGDAQLAIACDVEIAKLWPPTKFWAEYHRAMSWLIARAPYTPNPPAKLRGYEKNLVPYLDLIAALTARRDGAPELAACAASFARRNRDKRLTDWKRHDGDGRLPVRWDFRAASILARWRNGQS